MGRDDFHLEYVVEHTTGLGAHNTCGMSGVRLRMDEESRVTRSIVTRIAYRFPDAIRVTQQLWVAR